VCQARIDASLLATQEGVARRRKSYIFRCLERRPDCWISLIWWEFMQRQAMSERDDEHFELDEEFLNEQEESPSEIDRIVFDRVDRRAKPASIKRGKAAWSRLEDVLAERRLEKELREIFEEDK